MRHALNIERELERAVRNELTYFPAASATPSAKLLAALAAAPVVITSASDSTPTHRQGIGQNLKLLATILLFGLGAAYLAFRLSVPKIATTASVTKPSFSPGEAPVQLTAPRDTTRATAAATSHPSEKHEVRKRIGRWRQASSEGFEPRYWFTASAIGGKIYVIGGTNGPALYMTVQVFDTKTNSWTALAPSGTFVSRLALTSCVVNGKIYVMGGSRGSEIPSNMSDDLEIYDPTTNAWTTPKTTGTFTPRCVLSSAVLDGKIYVVGGFNARNDLSTLEVFDPNTNAWTTPETTGHFDPRGAFQAVEVDGKLYVVGGMRNGKTPATIQVFDPKTNHWDSVRAVGRFAPRCDHACGVIDGKIYVMGGATDGRTPLSKEAFQVFDPVTRRWSVPKFRGRFTSRVYVGSVVVNDKLYVLGGMDSTGSVVNTNDVFEPAP